MGVKRLFDVVVSATALLALSPLLLVLSLVIAVKLGRPVFFVQPRPGLHGRLFNMIKFRTMENAVDALGRPLADELRLTPFGRLLRTTSLDELPELWNVLKGDMSLIGPRPLLPQYLERYTRWQARRHEVRPGITGWAQVNGRNALSWDERFELDVWYVDNHTFLLDLRILLMTVMQVVGRHGISSKGHATMPEFMGDRTRKEER
jgi:lipopolysaccharide/colanic/teichoic acid biosynthesis glycosyltransferase